MYDDKPVIERPQSIDNATGTTLAERRRIRSKHRAEKRAAQRRIRSRAVTNAYRDGYEATFGGGEQPDLFRE